MKLRKANLSDAKNIKELYSYYILNTNASWQREERPVKYYEDMLKEHVGMYPLFIAEEDGKFVGLGSLSAFRSVCAYDRICENSIYLKKECKGKGYGTIIMQKLLDEAKKLGHWTVTAWIDSDNKKSIEFHEKFGFYICGEMPNIGNKSETRRSVTIMQIDLGN